MYHNFLQFDMKQTLYSLQPYTKGLVQNYCKS